MNNNFTNQDIGAVKKFLKNKDTILTQSKKVEEFEKRWSKWLGVKYSTFVNSGSSANFITISILKAINKNKKKNEIIVPTLTWVSDINSVIMNGFKPVFVDIDPTTLSMSSKEIIKKLNKKTLAVFITHAQGFNGLTDKLLAELKKRNIPLIEDVCESHGAKHKMRKLGTFGMISNFSFYYAHHMTTIEGGMICTDDPEVYQQLRMLRSHGMVREANDSELRKKYVDSNPELNPDFIFSYPAYNVRNNEIGGILGRSQLTRLDDIIKNDVTCSFGKGQDNLAGDVVGILQDRGFDPMTNFATDGPAPRSAIRCVFGRLAGDDKQDAGVARQRRCDRLI